MNRRTLLASMAALLVDRASPLVPVKVAVDPAELLRQRMDEVYVVTKRNMDRLLYGDLAYHEMIYGGVLISWDLIADVPERKSTA